MKELVEESLHCERLRRPSSTGRRVRFFHAGYFKARSYTSLRYLLDAKIGAISWRHPVRRTVKRFRVRRANQENQTFKILTFKTLTTYISTTSVNTVIPYSRSI